MLGFRPMSQGAVIYFHTIVINMNAQGLCAITKYYVNGGWKAPTHSPFLSLSLISHLPLYHVEAYQQCLSTLSSPGIQKYKECVSMTAGSIMEAGAGRTRVSSGQHSGLGTCAENWDPWNTWNPRRQQWDPRWGSSKTLMYSPHA